MSSEASTIVTLSAIAHPLTISQEGDALHMVLDPLQRGVPVALRQHGEWHLISPKLAAGQPPSRRLIDLPLRPALLLPPDLSCAEALRYIHSMEDDYLLVGQEEQLVGYVRLNELLLQAIDVAEQGELAWGFLDAILSFASVLIWHLPLPADLGQLAKHLPDLRIWGPLERLTGYTMQELIERLSQGPELLHPEDAKSFLSATQGLALPGGSADQVVRFRHKSGKWVWLRLQVFSAPRPDGSLELRGVSSDMTPMVAMQERLHETEQLYQTLAEETPSGVAILTGQDLVYVNRALSQALGLTPQQVVRKVEPLQIVHAEDRDKVKSDLQRLLRGQVTEQHLTFRITASDGEARFIEAHGRRIHHQGEPAVLVAMTDVTERTVEQQRRELLAAIHKAISLRQPRQTLQEAMTIIGERFPIDATCLLVLDKDDPPEAIPQWVRSPSQESFAALMETLYGSPKGAGPANEDPVIAQASNRRAFYAPDTKGSKQPADQQCARLGWRAYFALPLIIEPDYKAILYLYSRAPNPLGEAQRALLQELRPTFAAPVQAWRYERMLTELNQELETRVQRRTYELQVLYDLTRKIGYTLDYDDLMRLMLEHLHQAISYDVAASMLIDGGGLCA